MINVILYLFSQGLGSCNLVRRKVKYRQDILQGVNIGLGLLDPLFSSRNSLFSGVQRCLILVQLGVCCVNLISGQLLSILCSIYICLSRLNLILIIRNIRGGGVLSLLSTGQRRFRSLHAVLGCGNIILCSRQGVLRFRNLLLAVTQCRTSLVTVLLSTSNHSLLGTLLAHNRSYLVLGCGDLFIGFCRGGLCIIQCRLV